MSPLNHSQLRRWAVFIPDLLLTLWLVIITYLSCIVLIVYCMLLVPLLAELAPWRIWSESLPWYIWKRFTGKEQYDIQVNFVTIYHGLIFFRRSVVDSCWHHQITGDDTTGLCYYLMWHKGFVKVNYLVWHLYFPSLRVAPQCSIPCSSTNECAVSAIPSSPSTSQQNCPWMVL